MTETEKDSFLGQGAYLIVVRPEVPDSVEIGRRYDLESPTVLLSNHKDADIFVPTSEDTNYSVILFYHPQKGWLFENQGARGTLLLNGFPSEERRLTDGDLLQVGETVFHFLEGVGLFSDLYAQLFRMAHLDLLTEAFNKAYFWYILEEWINLSSRLKSPLSLLMIDIDFFKQVNEHGHSTGDSVLKQVAQRILRRVRKGDIFCRFGGEEFSLILPNTSKQNALTVAEEIRREVEKDPFVYKELSLPITISIGVAEYQKGMTKEEFQDKADHLLMHTAKKTGRNKVAG